MGNNFNYTSKPVTDCLHDDGIIENSPVISFTYGAASMQGWRKKQEDKFTCMANFSKGYSFFGLYDGHGGSEIAEYLQKNLHLEIQHFLESQDDEELALYLGFLSTDLSLKTPEVIAELNSTLEKENSKDSEQQAFMFHPRFLEDLRKRGENAVVSSILKHKINLDEVLDQESPNSAGPSREILVPKTTFNPERAVETHIQELVCSTQDSSVGGSTQLSSGAGSTRESNMAGPSQESNVAGPSQERNSTTDDEETDEEEIDEEGMDEEGIEEIGMDEVEKPIEYLLNDELESSDPEDEDFDVDDEDTSEGSDEETKTITSRFKLTAEEFSKMQPGELSGSTATVILLNEATIYVANVGDSRCVLSRDGEAIDMSIDHKPTDDEERDRIINNGGVVSRGRINDALDMSRAFGDFKLKGSSLAPPEQCVTAEPTIKSIPIDRDDEFLVIASDGLWNSMTSQEIVDYIRMRLKLPNCDLRDICDELFHLILAPDLKNDGSGCDNMSCIIIKFVQRGVRFPVGSTVALLGPGRFHSILSGGGIQIQNIDEF